MKITVTPAYVGPYRDEDVLPVVHKDTAGAARDVQFILERAHLLGLKSISVEIDWEEK